MIRILIADDHPVVVDGLETFLSGYPDLAVVGEASTFQQVLDGVAACSPDVLILDLNMPGMHSLDSITKLRRVAPATRIVVFSMYEAGDYADSLLEHGASAQVRKSSPPAELVAAIRRVASMELAPAPVSQSGYASLSARERDVFEYLVEGATTRDIAREMEVSASTVHTYILRIKTKLGVTSTIELVKYAFRRGLTK